MAEHGADGHLAISLDEFLMKKIKPVDHNKTHWAPSPSSAVLKKLDFILLDAVRASTRTPLEAAEAQPRPSRIRRRRPTFGRPLASFTPRASGQRRARHLHRRARWLAGEYSFAARLGCA